MYERGSSHCVRRVLWSTKYGSPLGVYRISAAGSSASAHAVDISAMDVFFKKSYYEPTKLCINQVTTNYGE
jgi:hypothetical protein